MSAPPGFLALVNMDRDLQSFYFYNSDSDLFFLSLPSYTFSMHEREIPFSSDQSHI